MSDRVLGAVIAVVMAIAISIVLGIVIVTELDTTPLGVGVWTRRGLDLAELTNPVVILLLCGIPVGVLFGSLIGSLAPVQACSRRARAVIYGSIALPSLLVCLPYWPGLALFAIPLTLFHAAFAARRTEPPTLPTAIVRKSR